MLTIKTATEEEYSTVRSFYHSLIDAMRTFTYKPGWKKEVYPSDAYLMETIKKQQLYIGLLDTDIAAAMIINHEGNESYCNAQWPIQASADEIIVIHALGVHPMFSRRGIGKEMVAHVIAIAKEEGVKAVRLDVLEGNLPAEKLYTNLGFQYVDTIQMYYEDTGWTNFKLYEYPIHR